MCDNSSGHADLVPLHGCVCPNIAKTMRAAPAFGARVATEMAKRVDIEGNVLLHATR